MKRTIRCHRKILLRYEKIIIIQVLAEMLELPLIETRANVRITRLEVRCRQTLFTELGFCNSKCREWYLTMEHVRLTTDTDNWAPASRFVPTTVTRVPPDLGPILGRNDVTETSWQQKAKLKQTHDYHLVDAAVHARGIET
jgi:hypothetical protein